jgi:hypothetical protein
MMTRDEYELLKKARMAIAFWMTHPKPATLTTSGALRDIEEYLTKNPQPKDR